MALTSLRFMSSPSHRFVALLSHCRQVFMDSPGLVNGFYNVWIEGSLATSYPDLVSLFGLDQYDDGSAKYMGVSLRNNSNRPVPIQTVRSKIAELAGPDVPTPIGGAATFTWETQGYGEQFCYVDGQKVANTADMVRQEAAAGLGVVMKSQYLSVCTHAVQLQAWLLSTPAQASSLQSTCLTHARACLIPPWVCLNPSA